MILIVGGSGALGSAVVRRLLAAGEAVRVMTRTPSSVAALQAAGAEIVSGDLLDRQSVSRACANADAVVAAAHAMLGRGRRASVHVDGTGHRQLIDIAKVSGVRHIVYTSVYDYGSAYHSVPFFRIKREVEQYLKASGLRHTIVRPTAFMETHAHMLIGERILANGKVVLLGRGEQPRNFVAADDVARVVVGALRDASAAGETVDVGGPENLTAMDVVRLYERASGRQAKLTRVPIAMVRALSGFMQALHPGVSQILKLAVLTDTIEEPFDVRPSQAWLPEPTRLEDWVSRRLAVHR